MNIFALIILSALLLDYLLNLVADILNLRMLSGEIPPEFSDVYDPETYRRSQNYTRVKTLFGLFASSVSLAAHNLSNLRPHPFYVFLNYSHPPLQERVRAIESRMKTE